MISPRHDARALPRTIHHVANGDGWQLALRHVRPPDPLPGRRPVVIVPGYGMNSFIFGFHPRGASLEEYLAWRGLDVWSLDLRAQGEAIRQGGSMRFDLADLALTDLPKAIEYVLEHRSPCSASPVQHDRSPRVDVLGASLGATLMYALAALGPARNLGSLVAIGGPLRWVDAHPLVRFLARSPEALGLLPFPATRRLITRAMPLLLRFPKLLELYVHTDIVDMGQVSTMLRTVETPSRHLNREIAHWVRHRDLVLRGRNVTDALRAVTLPLLCIVANADGVVPPRTARSGLDAIGSAAIGSAAIGSAAIGSAAIGSAPPDGEHTTRRGATRELLEVGDARHPFAHADLFVSNEAHSLVFEPIHRFLARTADE